MTYGKWTIVATSCLLFYSLTAQQRKSVAVKLPTPASDSLIIPVSKAALGAFPYFTTLRNFYANDSVNMELNRVYFFDGKKYITVDGRVSSQNLNIRESDKPIASIFQCIQEFDKVIATLGGIKIYTGKLPDEPLKKLTGEDLVALASKKQLAPSAYYGVVEYVIKTAEKEVWVQLQPYSLESKFYTLLVVEKITPLISLNTNKENRVLADLEKNKKAIVYLSFEPDNATLVTESSDEILSIAGVFQLHPDWKLIITAYSTPVGNADYTLQLTQKRADAVKQALLDLGVKPGAVNAKGLGAQQPIGSNDTEQGRLTNTRFEIILQ